MSEAFPGFEETDALSRDQLYIKSITARILRTLCLDPMIASKIRSLTVEEAIKCLVARQAW